jgi:ankyrin repeat protein
MDDWFENERLHRAAAAGDCSLVQELLRGGCAINAFDTLGLTPLHYAVRGEHLAVVDLLLRSGADVDAHDERVIGNTPLNDAAGECSLRMVRKLVESGADPTIRGWMQISALDRAKRRRRQEGTGSEGQAVYDFLRKAVSGRD